MMVRRRRTARPPRECERGREHVGPNWAPPMPTGRRSGSPRSAKQRPKHGRNGCR